MANQSEYLRKNGWEKISSLDSLKTMRLIDKLLVLGFIKVQINSFTYEYRNSRGDVYGYEINNNLLQLDDNSRIYATSQFTIIIGEATWCNYYNISKDMLFIQGNNKDLLRNYRGIKVADFAGDIPLVLCRNSGSPQNDFIINNKGKVLKINKHTKLPKIERTVGTIADSLRGYNKEYKIYNHLGEYMLTVDKDLNVLPD